MHCFSKYHCCQSLIGHYHVFNTIKEAFSPAIQNQVRGDARIMVEVSDCLANLDIAIGFLVSVGGDPDTTLHSFMTDTLQMEAGALTPMVNIKKVIMGDLQNADILIHLSTRWHLEEAPEDMEIH